MVLLRSVNAVGRPSLALDAAAAYGRGRLESA